MTSTLSNNEKSKIRITDAHVKKRIDSEHLKKIMT